MAKNEVKLKTDCPKCETENIMEIDKDTKVASNITILICPVEECEHRFAKDQSVKLSSTIVIEAADCMESLGGYSSLGEFVRECVRARIQLISHQKAATGMSNLMGIMADDPELMRLLLEGEEE